MKRCGARPYKGTEKYIFISYSHKDRPRVFPIIERLARDGYRVWYDEGIDPGSEWPTIIAEHLLNCEVCIPLISKNFLESANCHQEITYAMKEKKKVMTVMLEDVTLPAGLDMQLSVIHKVYKHTQTDEEFFDSLYNGKNLRPCLGMPNPAIRVSVPEDYIEKKSKSSYKKQTENTDGSQGRMAENVNGTTDFDGKEPENAYGGTEFDGYEVNLNESNPENAERTINVDWQESENAVRTVDPGQKKPQNPEAAVKDKKNKKLKREQKRAASISDGAENPVAAEGEKNPVAKGWRKYLPPGYRTGKIWHMLVATYYYATVIVSLVVSTGSNLLENIVLWLFCIVLFFGSAAIWGNYLDCWQKIPFMKNKYARVFGFVLYPLLIFIVMSILALVILAFAGVY